MTSGKEGQGRPHRACWLEDLRVFREITHSKGRQLCLNSVGAWYLDVFSTYGPPGTGGYKKGVKKKKRAVSLKTLLRAVFNSICNSGCWGGAKVTLPQQGVIFQLEPWAALENSLELDQTSERAQCLGSLSTFGEFQLRHNMSVIVDITDAKLDHRIIKMVLATTV